MYAVRPRLDVIEKARNESGYSTLLGLGKAMGGVGHAQVGNILFRSYRPGNRVIAGLLKAFPGYRFEDLFEVIEAAAADEATDLEAAA